MNKKINLITKPPRRTPIIVSQKIKFILKNKIFCELGCAVKRYKFFDVFKF